MKFRGLILLIAFGCWSFTGIYRQPQLPISPFSMIRSIPMEAKDIQTDKMGNLYIVSKTNQLYKYSAEGKLLSTLNYSYRGNISYVDPTNPLEIYVFYKELNQVVFLDNNLAYRGEMKLNDYGVVQASAIARSYDNGLWVFDMGDLQLKKMDKNGENQQFSGNIRSFINADKVSPTFILDNGDRVFVNDSSNGVIVFDVFAHYLKNISSIKGCNDIKVIDDDVYYYRNSAINKYNLKSFATYRYTIPDSASVIIDLSIEKERLYLLRQKSIDIYAF